MQRLIVMSWGVWVGAVTVVVATPVAVRAATSISGMQVSATVLPTCVVSVAASDQGSGKTAQPSSVRSACSAGVSYAIETQSASVAGRGLLPVASGGPASIAPSRTNGATAPILVTISY